MSINADVKSNIASRFLGIFLAGMIGPSAVRAAEYDAAKWGVVPGGTQDCTIAFQRAVDELSRQPGSTLKLAPGVYHFYATQARQRIDYQSNTTVVSPRRYAILVENAGRLTIDGRGATLMMHGEMTAIGIDGAEKVTLKNFNVDWDRLLTSQAKVVEQGPDWQVIELDTNRFPCSVESGNLQMIVEGHKSTVWATMECDAATGRNLGDGGGITRAEGIAPGQFKIWGARRVEKVGNVLILRHHLRSHAGIFVHNSQGVSLDHVELWASCGLGMLFQHSRDMTLRKTSVRPRPGSGLVVGPKDDGFHFSGCSGKILIDGCRIEGTPDDPINIHGTCLPMDNQVAGNTIAAHFGHDQSIGQGCWGKPGDVVSVLDRETLLPVERNVIKAFRLTDPRKVEIVFEKPFARAVTSRQAVENLSDTPSATIRHCWFGNNRARGILCSTPRPVVIEDNTFAIQGAAILIPGDANGWFESGAVSDVTIRRNVFANCLIAPTQFSDGVIAIWPEIQRDVPGRFFHRNIRVEDNTFQVFDRPLLYARNVDGLVFRGNRIVRTDFRPPWHPNHDAIYLRHCRAVRIGRNQIEGELLSRHVAHPDTPAAEIKIGAGSVFRLSSAIAN